MESVTGIKGATGIQGVKLEAKKFCQSCKNYSRKTKKCALTDSFVARKKHCDKFERK